MPPAIACDIGWRPVRPPAPPAVPAERAASGSPAARGSSATSGDDDVDGQRPGGQGAGSESGEFAADTDLRDSEPGVQTSVNKLELGLPFS